MKSKKSLVRRLASGPSNWLGLCTLTLTVISAGNATAQDTWDGGGTADVLGNYNWADGANWVDNGAPTSGILNFEGVTNTTTFNNNTAGTSFGAINLTNDGTAGKTAGFVLNGNAITLNGNINTTAIPSPGVAINNVINLDLILNVNRTIGTNGVGSGGTSHNVTVNGNISETGGAWSLTKGGSFPSGTLTLTGNNTYTGLTIIETGTVTVSKIADGGDSNLGYGNLRMAFGSQGGTLNYTGSGNTTARTLQIGVAGQATGTGGAFINANGTNGGTGLVFSATNFTVAEATATAASRTLTLGGTNTDANRISGIIANVSGTTLTNLTKASAGLWIVSGASTYTGATTVSDGTLAGIGTNAFGSTSGISIAGSGTLSLRGDSSTSFQKASDSNLYTVTTSASGSTINVDRATVSGTGAKTMTIGALGTTSTAATYQLNFSGANNTSLSAGAMTGSISTAAANVTISNNIATGGNLTLASYTSANTSGGETVTFTGSGNTNVTGAITPSATALALTKSGSGTLRLDSSNAYSGLTSVTGGTLHLNNANALPAGGALTLNGGVLGLGTGNFTRSLGTLVDQVNIAGTNSGFAAYGADRFVNLGGASASVSFGAGNFFTAGTTLVLGATTATHTVDFQNPIVLSGTRFFRADDGAAAVDGRLSGAITGSTTFSKTGAGTLELTNTGNAWTNTTFIDSGTLRLGAANVLPGNTVEIKRSSTTDTHPVLDLNGFSETIGAINFGHSTTNASSAGGAQSIVNSGGAATLTLGGTVTYRAGSAGFENGQATISANLATGTAGNRDITVGDGSAAQDLVITGTISGGSITKLGAGTLELTNTNSYTGSTSANSGTLIIAGDHTGNGQIVVSNNGSILQFGNGASINGSSVNSGTIFVNNAATVQINKADGGTVTNAVASNPSATTKLSGANASGTTNTFTATSYNNGGGFAVNSTNAGAVLAFSGASGAIDLKGTNLTVSGAGNTLLTSAGQGFYSSTTASKVIKQGAGILIFQGNQGFTGNMEIDAGTVRVDVAQSNSGTYFVGNGTTTGTSAALLLGGGNAGISGGVSFNRTVSINPGNGSNRTIGGTNTSGTNSFSSAINMSGVFGEDRSVVLTAATGGTVEIDGLISGAGQNISKSGGGAVVLANANSYTGTTSVNAGALIINGNQSTATGAVTVSNSDSRLMGTGTVGGATTINAAAIHSAGSATGAVGNQYFSSSLTYADSSIFSWEIAKTNESSQTRGADYDAVNVTGTLAGLDGTDGGSATDAIFRVVIGDADFSDTFWDTNRTWGDIFTAADGSTDKPNWASIFGGGFEYYKTDGTALGTPIAEGSFSFVDSGTSLKWTAVPEPTSALAGLLITAGLLRRRRA